MQIESRGMALLRVIKKILLVDLIILLVIGIVGWWWQWPTLYAWGRIIMTVSYIVMGFGLLTLSGNVGGFSEKDQRISRDLLLQNPRQAVADSRMRLNFSFTTVLAGLLLFLIGYCVRGIS